MRAFDICLLVICLQLSLTFISSIGLFGDNLFYTAPQQTGNGFMTGSMSDTEKLVGAQSYTTIDYLTMSISMIVSSLGLIATLLGSVIIFIPQLILVFQVPLPLAIVIQALIYVMYGWAYLQFLSGRSGAMLQ